MLKVNDIKEWLIEHRSIYQKMKSQEFPPFGNSVYDMYGHLFDFIKYYRYRHKCEKELQDLHELLINNSDLKKWTKRNEILGSQELLMFEVLYASWDNGYIKNQIKIHEGLYTEREPFTNIICYCKIIQIVFWNHEVHKVSFTDRQQMVIRNEVRKIMHRFWKKDDT